MDPTEPRTETLFERRLSAAVRAGAWLLLVDIGVLLIQWFAYLTIMARRPPQFLALMGADVSWESIQSVWLHGMVAFKVLFWAHLLLVLWGAIWSSMLRTARRGEPHGAAPDVARSIPPIPHVPTRS